MQSAKAEALDHFLVFGEAQLRHIVSSYVEYHNACRPHQALGNVLLNGLPAPESWENASPQGIVCEERLGGLLKHCRRQAG